MAAAAANKVYVANGSASGAWATLAAASITDNAITTAKILDANVTTAKITDANVTTAKIAADAITNAKIADDAVDTENIADDAITSALIDNNAVVTAGIANDAVTIDKTNVPRGGCYFYNLGSPYTLTYGSATQKVSPTTIVRNVANQMTEGTNARVTYTGVASQFVKIDWDASLYQATGTKNLTLAVHKNGTLIAGSEIYVTTATGVVYNVAGATIVAATTNDYFEIYAFNTDSSGNMLFNKVGITVQGI